MTANMAANTTAKISALISALTISSVAMTPVAACTDFVVSSTDGSMVEGRTMEWAEDLKSQIVLHPRGENRTSNAPDGKSGISWKSKYGFLGVNGYGLDITLDGMNEKGLSMSALWLPGSEYQNVVSGQENKALCVLDIGTWVLGNFATVTEAESAITKVIVWAESREELGGAKPTLHIALHDPQGQNAVIEFVDGQQKIYENPNGVLTNAPTFDWHITNLRNYIQVSAQTPAQREFKGTVLSPPGNGGGFLGIPGDWTPPSRFVRATAMLAFACPADDAPAAVNLAQHVLNAVDIPLGDVRVDNAHHDYTQWAVIKDMASNVFYYRSYDDLTLRAIDLKRLDFGGGKAAGAGGGSSLKSIPIAPAAGKGTIADVTSSLQ